MDEREFEEAILKIYVEDMKETNERCGGFEMHYTISSEQLQKMMWKKHRINRPQLLKLFDAFFRNQPRPSLTEHYPVQVFGGPSSHFKKNNWVEADGRHYLQIRIVLTEYRRMRERDQKAIPRD